MFLRYAQVASILAVKNTSTLRTSSNPFLAGNLAPVDIETTAFDLRVTGKLPGELTGRYLRNGPNPIGEVNPDSYHWFLGSGMVHGIRINDGKAEWYRNRWVRDRNVAKSLGEQVPPSDWPADHAQFASNTNVIGHAGATWALVEGGSPPIEMNYELETVCVSNFANTLPQAFSAHPKRDPRTGELHVMAYWWGWGNQVQYLVVGVDGKVRRTVDIALPGGPMMHDCAITEKYVLIFDLPCLFNLELAMSGRSFPYIWNADYTARVGLLPREGVASDIKWVEINSCYIFHPLNAYDAPDGTVVLDAARHEKMFDVEQRGPNEGFPTLDRWVLNPKTGKATEQRLDDRPQEFPRMNESLIGMQHNFGYLAGISDVFRQADLIKQDLAKKTTQVRHDGENFGYGEPVFIARNDAKSEDDGYVMALRHNTETDLSDLVVLDAQDFCGEPVAVVSLPARVPNGFHGNWIAD
jgi:carotenoid cleavage dioxygenase